jgi:hypothetical protein
VKYGPVAGHYYEEKWSRIIVLIQIPGLGSLVPEQLSALGKLRESSAVYCLDVMRQLQRD